MTENTNIFKRLMKDSELRSTFIKNPDKTLRDAGITIFEGKEIRVYENDALNLHYTLLDRETDLRDFEKIDRRFISIQEKVWEDDDFKTKLLADPNAVISEVFGSLPENLTIHMHENKGNTINFILPALNATDELSDGDLEMVAGGKGSIGDPLDTVTDIAGTVYDKIPTGVFDVVSKVGDAALWVNDDAVDSIPKPSFTFLNGW
ncbi:MAG: hypothetical protein CVV64_18610 [Candidatus Wallbacteria bacterium HGW-Wallbacteria-1]|uniref:Nitrile hydratase alpha /Thiocyanate hydrolase gamma domain-containing protein n=1 Tax=Candidatus Wallbacteria bacterium HGW-Wallbacteria-1 TaxID=2013854 RepID=A0A2N1PJE4_9BACT|nr:MAG: hypothetical protein CVV64_18610 [Candidatus Wallbacteria bacterium HGW-Wallbacteria-1]